MFTGIIRHVGKVASVATDGKGVASLVIECPDGFLDNKKTGDSVSVDGCCLTVVEIDGNLRAATFNLGPETLARTAAKNPGDPVHLEGSLLAGEQMGGHFVLGHVDGVSEVLEVSGQDGFVATTLSVPDGLDLRLVAPQGSVAIAGVSLTVTDVSGDSFSLQLIPATFEHTHLSAEASLVAGKKLNFEADCLARHVVRCLDA